MPGAVPENECEHIRSRVRAAYLCNGPDGPRSRAAVAWAVKGRVPEDEQRRQIFFAAMSPRGARRFRDSGVFRVLCDGQPRALLAIG